MAESLRCHCSILCLKNGSFSDGTHFEIPFCESSCWRSSNPVRRAHNHRGRPRAFWRRSCAHGRWRRRPFCVVVQFCCGFRLRRRRYRIIDAIAVGCLAVGADRDLHNRRVLGIWRPCYLGRRVRNPHRWCNGVAQPCLDHDCRCCEADNACLRVRLRFHLVGIFRQNPNDRSWHEPARAFRRNCPESRHARQPPRFGAPNGRKVAGRCLFDQIRSIMNWPSPAVLIACGRSGASSARA